ESGGQTEIKHGLSAGQRVVVSSQFLIDSEASLKGVEARLNSAPSAVAAASPPVPMAASAPRHSGEAKVVGIGKDALTLSHGAIPTLKWGPMTMDFKLPPDGSAPKVQVGDRVSFEFFMGADDLPQLTRVTPMAAGGKP
ncbi:copper-binding protein, partial [Delftia tsuruhatensis]